MTEYFDSNAASGETETAGPMSMRMMPAGWLETFAAKLLEAGLRVVAPVERNDTIQFAPISDASQIVTDRLNPVTSVKEVLLPRTEPVLAFREKRGDVDFVPVPRDPAPTVVIGCRPCDAAAVERLTAVFAWDYDDELYLSRLRDTTFVTLACTEPDENCFCTSVGLGPASDAGSDVLVQATSEGLCLSAVTEKGEKLIREYAGSDGTEHNSAPPAIERRPEPRFDVVAVKEWLDDNFDSELWDELGLRCIGCGVCSFLCPTCYCFDIVDEAEWNSGQRRRNWDSCAFAQFTLHASGHNPRPDQKARYRQRIMHKFKYFPERFGELGCVGCGRCIRRCPAGLNLISILQRMK